MAFGLKTKSSERKLPISAKLRISIWSIITLLIVTMVLSVVEFRRMSTHVSDLISNNIRTINLSTELAVSVDEYNLQILSAVGDSLALSKVDTAAVGVQARRVFSTLENELRVNVDSVKLSYQRYFLTSLKLGETISSDFIDTRDWYFSVLQPEYNLFRTHMDAFNVRMYDKLRYNSVSFDESFYRSIIPSAVSSITAILLCLLLLFFIMAYYVKPLLRMLKDLEAYSNNNVGYSCSFEGDDELQQLNTAISELVDENQNLKNRLRNRES